MLINFYFNTMYSKNLDCLNQVLVNFPNSSFLPTFCLLNKYTTFVNINLQYLYIILITI